MACKSCSTIICVAPSRCTPTDQPSPHFKVPIGIAKLQDCDSFQLRCQLHTRWCPNLFLPWLVHAARARIPRLQPQPALQTASLPHQTIQRARSAALGAHAPGRSCSLHLAASKRRRRAWGGQSPAGVAGGCREAVAGVDGGERLAQQAPLAALHAHAGMLTAWELRGKGAPETRRGCGRFANLHELLPPWFPHTIDAAKRSNSHQTLSLSITWMRAASPSRASRRAKR